ncbi:hypothetical protein YC2023_034782 [Brassica napus]
MPPWTMPPSFKSLCPEKSNITRDRPLKPDDDSWLCDLSVINGYDSPRSLCAVEDRYLAWS